MARDDLDTSHAREQGRMAAKMTKDRDDPNVFTQHDCPYGPGEHRDAWIAGFSGDKEETRQVDSSTPTTADVRTETSKVVSKGAARKGRSGGKRGSRKGQPKTNVETQLTGTAETALETHVKSDPNASEGGGIDTTLGDPRGTEGDKTQISKNDVM